MIRPPPPHEQGGIIKNRTKAVIAGIVLATAVLTLGACSSDADTASYNLSREAERFEVERKITAINAFTDTIVMEVVGRCSLESADSFLAGAVELTCKVSDDQFIKNFIMLGDNAILSVEQSQTVDVSVYNYTWIVKPEGLIPSIDVETKVETGD